ncbi:MAG: hypothetical protein EBR82_08150 [Caulobacteraceae bacterium]|nr:hypothetical protein [Caulobacteraceae bacterium]
MKERHPWVEEARELLEAGDLPQHEIAARFGVSRGGMLRACFPDRYCKYVRPYKEINDREQDARDLRALRLRDEGMDPLRIARLIAAPVEHVRELFAECEA